MPEPVPADVLQAISHPLRLALLVALERREQSAADLATTLDVRPPAITHHLALLRRAGLVHDGAHPGTLRAAAGWAEIAERLRRLQDGAR